MNLYDAEARRLDGAVPHHARSTMLNSDELTI